MPQTYNSPQEAEDAFYDALEEGDLERLLSVAHLSWIQTDDIAIHQVEETLQKVPPDTPPPPPFYGTNIYRKDSDGWRLIVHQNAPTPQPPPPELEMPAE